MIHTFRSLIPFHLSFKETDSVEYEHNRDQKIAYIAHALDDIFTDVVKAPPAKVQYVTPVFETVLAVKEGGDQGVVCTGIQTTAPRLLSKTNWGRLVLSSIEVYTPMGAKHGVRNYARTPWKDMHAPLYELMTECPALMSAIDAIQPRYNAKEILLHAPQGLYGRMCLINNGFPSEDISVVINLHFLQRYMNSESVSVAGLQNLVTTNGIDGLRKYFDDRNAYGIYSDPDGGVLLPYGLHHADPDKWFLRR